MGSVAVRLSDIDVLSGFGHPVLIAILCLMILGRGLLMTGALEPVVRLLTRLWKWSPRLGLLLTLVFGVGASAFCRSMKVVKKVVMGSQRVPRGAPCGRL